MHEEMMVGFRRRRTQSRSGWGTPRPSLVASDVVSSRLVVGPVAAIIGGALGLTADANAANPDQLNLNPRPCRRHHLVITAVVLEGRSKSEVAHTRKQAVDANDVSGHLSTMSRDITLQGAYPSARLRARSVALTQPLCRPTTLQ